MDQLALKRAAVARDCRLVSALDVLEELVQDIKAGKHNPNKLLVIFTEDLEDGGDKVHERFAGVTKDQILGLMLYEQHQILHEWERG